MSARNTERPIVVEPRRSVSVSGSNMTTTQATRTPVVPDSREAHPAEALNVPPHLPGHGNPAHDDVLLETTRRHLEEARIRLEGHDLSGRIVTNATSRIKKDSLLDADGKNLAQWIKDLKELAREHLTDTEFFFKPCDNTIFERIGRAIILATIHPNLTYEFQDYPT